MEVIAGPHRIVSLMTSEAVEELDLQVGDEAVCVVKATNVIVEIPSPREPVVMRSVRRSSLRSRSCSPPARERRTVAPAGTGDGAARTPTASTGSASPRRRAVELTIFGAASLKAVLDKVKTAYDAAHPGVTLTMSTDSSSALETQIEQGAPADIFLSADTTNPQKLVEKGLASGNRCPSRQTC